jgi:hypothetical protein
MLKEVGELISQFGWDEFGMILAITALGWLVVAVILNKWKASFGLSEPVAFVILGFSALGAWAGIQIAQERGLAELFLWPTLGVITGALLGTLAAITAVVALIGVTAVIAYYSLFWGLQVAHRIWDAVGGSPW